MAVAVVNRPLGRRIAHCGRLYNGRIALDFHGSRRSRPNAAYLQRFSWKRRERFVAEIAWLAVLQARDRFNV